MATRREMLFEAQKKSPGHEVIPATTSFKIDKKKKALKAKSPEDKMKIALRKVLAQMSEQNEHGCRFYIDNNEIQLIRRPVEPHTRPDEPKKYQAAGRCRIGICHPEGHKSSKIIEFSISFKDVKDDRGIDDVDFFQPTTIDELPKTTRIK